MVWLKNPWGKLRTLIGALWSALTRLGPGFGGGEDAALSPDCVLKVTHLFARTLTWTLARPLLASAARRFLNLPRCDTFRLSSSAIGHGLHLYSLGRCVLARYDGFLQDGLIGTGALEVSSHGPP